MEEIKRDEKKSNILWLVVGFVFVLLALVAFLELANYSYDEMLKFVEVVSAMILVIFIIALCAKNATFKFMMMGSLIGAVLVFIFYCFIFPYTVDRSCKKTYGDDFEAKAVEINYSLNGRATWECYNPKTDEHYIAP